MDWQEIPSSLQTSWWGNFGCTVPRPWCYSEEIYFRRDEKVQTEMCW